MSLSLTDRTPGVLPVDEAPEVLVGSRYIVNAAYTVPNLMPYAGALIPLLGPQHEDAEIIKFPHEHWHIDWRFVNDGLRGSVLNYLRKKYVFIQRREKYERESELLGLVLTQAHMGTVHPHEMMCWREHDTWTADPSFMYALESAYADKRACKDVCPHRGISLKGAPGDPVLPGLRVCPGHGLAWDIETGRLVRRAFQPPVHVDKTTGKVKI